MKKHLGKALAMAVIMSVFAGGQVYAAATTTADTTSYGAATAGPDNNNLAIGNGAVAGGTSGSESLAIGNASAKAYSAVAIGYSASANANATVALGVSSNASASYATAIGDQSNATGEFSVAIGYKSEATEANTFSVGNSSTQRRIVNVAAGTANNDAVNLKQMNDALSAKADASDVSYLSSQMSSKADASTVSALSSQMSSKADASDVSYLSSQMSSKADASTVSSLSSKVSSMSSDISTLQSQVGSMGSVSSDISALKSDMSTAQSDISQLQSDISGLGSMSSDISTLKSDMSTAQADISQLKSDSNSKADKTALNQEINDRKQGDADTLKDAKDYADQEINKLSSSVGDVTKELLKTNDRVDRVGATAAALAGIHYQSMAKGQSQVAVGMGGYKGKKATALGLAYQITDRVSGSVAGAANGSEHMFNVGFNYLFGQHSAKDIAQCAAGPGSVSLKEAELQAQVDSLKANNEAMQARMTQLEAMVKALATK